MNLFLNDHPYDTGIAIHCRDAILAGDNGAMRQHPAAIGDDC
jgi:hypothetical protein